MGLEEDATLEEIKKAYRGLAYKYHPDKCKDEKQKSELAIGEIQLCLTQKFKYNPDYAKTISPYIAEAKQHTPADMKAYSLCVNNIKQCGASNCDEPKKS